MAKNNRITAADVLRFPPHIQAQIHKQMAEQGSALPLPRGHAAVPTFKMTPKVYIGFGAYFMVMALIALALLATFPGR